MRLLPFKGYTTPNRVHHLLNRNLGDDARMIASTVGECKTTNEEASSDSRSTVKVN
jgi:hypothetical protein